MGRSETRVYAVVNARCDLVFRRLRRCVILMRGFSSGGRGSLVCDASLNPLQLWDHQNPFTFQFSQKEVVFSLEARGKVSGVSLIWTLSFWPIVGLRYDLFPIPPNQVAALRSWSTFFSPSMMAAWALTTRSRRQCAIMQTRTSDSAVRIGGGASLDQSTAQSSSSSDKNRDFQGAKRAESWRAIQFLGCASPPHRSVRATVFPPKWRQILRSCRIYFLQHDRNPL